jgi:hypothetical protein
MLLLQLTAHPGRFLVIRLVETLVLEHTVLYLQNEVFRIQSTVLNLQQDLNPNISATLISTGTYFIVTESLNATYEGFRLWLIIRKYFPSEEI